MNLKTLDPRSAFDVQGGPRIGPAAFFFPPELVIAHVALGWSLPVENLLGLQIPHHYFHFLHRNNPLLILLYLRESHCLRLGPPPPL